MSQPIEPGTPHHELALKLGSLLKQTRAKRKVGSRVLAEAAGVSRTQVMHYEQGRNIPRVETAHRLAQALDEKRIVEYAMAARTRLCKRCRLPLTVNGGRPPEYCGPACRKAAQPGTREVEKRRYEQLSQERRTMRLAIDAMCRQCPDGEDGFCRLADCPLRHVSPLPFYIDKTVVKMVRR